MCVGRRGMGVALKGYGMGVVAMVCYGVGSPAPVRAAGKSSR